VAWAIAFGAIAMAGFGGRLTDDEPAETPRSLASSAPVVIPVPSIAPLVALSDPAPPPDSVTGIPIWIRGHAAPEVRQVLLVLVDGETRIGRQTVRPSASGRFGGVFTLLPPRRAMDLTVIAVGRDSGADAISTTRRAVHVSPLHAVAAGPAVDRPRLGEDGVLGSRGVDLAALPQPSLAPKPPGWGWPVGQLAWQANPVQR
jgi:hypothetical protein